MLEPIEWKASRSSAKVETTSTGSDMTEKRTAAEIRVVGTASLARSHVDAGAKASE
jgi:hypothetical protein